MKKKILTEKAPGALGAYSQAIDTGDTLYISGQLPIDVTTGETPEALDQMAIKSLSNAKIICEEAGYDITNTVKCTMLMDDINNFKILNEGYLKFFEDEGTEILPARTAFQAGKLPFDAKVEIDLIVTK
ncbi:MAG: Rid family detoxifying hydrolase [Mycoplasmatales bacterium]